MYAKGMMALILDMSMLAGRTQSMPAEEEAGIQPRHNTPVCMPGPYAAFSAW